MGGFVTSPPPIPEASEDEDDDDDAIAFDDEDDGEMLAHPVMTRCLLDTFTLCHS